MSKIKLQIAGTPEENSTTPPLGGHAFDAIVQVKPTARYRIEATRAGAPRTSIETSENAIVELELEGGVRLWTTLEQLQQDCPGAIKRSGAKADAYVLPHALPLSGPTSAARGATRGIGEWALKALRVIDVDVASASAKAIAAKLEAKLEPGPGLYRIAASDALSLVPANKVTSNQPILIFLHGTASNTRAAFGDLWQLGDPQRSGGDIGEDEKRALRQQLFKHYAEQVYAFEHRSLSESPIENALALAQLLPAGARLHLLSHSRGGLVGELLCRSFGAARDPFNAADFALFADGKNRDGVTIDRKRDRDALKKLNDVLKQKRFKVERFVRVACPARGTTLASGRLDRWLSVVVNLFGQIPGFNNNPIYEFTTALMLAVIKKRTDPSELPGLEAMMPSAPLIRMLNFVEEKSSSDLTVIAGDVEGSNLLERLKFLVTDWFYQDDHDLVVDTVSMSGGAPREAASNAVDSQAAAQAAAGEKSAARTAVDSQAAAQTAAGAESAARTAAGARRFFERGPRVNHFRYFRNPESVRRVYVGLLGSPEDLAGFEPLQIDYQALATRGAAKRSRAAAQARPIVFVLPGIMGSHLAVRGNRIWMDLFDLAAGGMSSLRIDAKQVEPDGVLGTTYAKLIDFLGDTHEVVPFPYDWRRPLKDAAAALATAIEAKLTDAERNKLPISVLAHSMGGLVMRTLIATNAKLWARMGQHADSRFIMLGTPNGGSYSIPVMLTARDPLVGKLALLDLGHSEADLLKVIARFPGPLQMLPAKTRWDFFDSDFWQQLSRDDLSGKQPAWSLPAPQDLAAAREARALLDASAIDAQRMLYVAGCAKATPFDLEFDLNAPLGKRLRYQATTQGDGRVPWETGLLPSVKTWYMDAVHGDLANHEESFPALLDLLRQGTTTRLASVPPATRGAPLRFDLPAAPEPAVLPSEEDLATSAVGGGRRVKKEQQLSRLAVGVVHGNLAYVSHVVAVGHYQGDAIVSAEGYLDRQLGGKLSASLQLGLYPGAPGSAEVFLEPGRQPAGAIVVGLGQVGQLTPGELTKSFKRGALMYASSIAETLPAGSPLVPITLASLLIGTGAGGIAVGDSLVALLRGLAQAADALGATRYRDVVRIERLELIELYEDRAIQAARTLLHAARETEFQARFAFDAEVRSLPSGRRRVAYEDDPNWWRRLQILSDDDDNLQFNTLTDRARVEVELQGTQRALVDEFLAQAQEQTRTDNDLGATLFELLIPNRLKEQAPNQEDMVLLLDDRAARYPWELLIDRSAGGGTPLCVQAGLIRQLHTQTYREVVSFTREDSVLVVGDPALGRAHEFFPVLDGAKREAEVVAEHLGKDMQSVKLCLRQDANSIVRALFAGEYKILHLAGHGVYDFITPPELKPSKSATRAETPVSGMVIGAGVYLTPNEVEQMRSVPELVFINCCHLGRIEGALPAAHHNRHRLAANLAAQFIRMGVKAVVSAGWEVDDEAASAFAATFYTELCQGATFGDAVLEARKRIFRDFPNVNTWGAYQCYGDHAYRLRAGNGKTKSADNEFSYVASGEVLQELDHRAAEAKTATPGARDWLLKRVDGIQQHLLAQHPAWIARPELLAAFGRTYAELDAFKSAIDFYRRAIAAEEATYPVATLEQLANLQVRYAAWLHRAHATDKLAPSPAELIQQSIELIDTLLRFGETRERLNIRASAFKRKALIDRLSREQALQEMIKIYERADALARDANGMTDAYSRLNALSGHALLALTSGQSFSIAESALTEISDSVRRSEARDASFWNWIAAPDTLLISSLASGEFDGRAAQIIDGYRSAINRAASPRETRSVRENLEFLLDVLNDAKKTPVVKRVSAELRKILKALD